MGGHAMRPIRVLIGILGLDQHEVGAMSVARMLRDAGMEVVYLGRFNLPNDIAKAALEEGADVVGLSCHSWEYLHYLDPLLAALREQGLGLGRDRRRRAGGPGQGRRGGLRTHRRRYGNRREHRGAGPGLDGMTAIAASPAEEEP